MAGRSLTLEQTCVCTSEYTSEKPAESKKREEDE